MKKKAIAAIILIIVICLSNVSVLAETGDGVLARLEALREEPGYTLGTFEGNCYIFAGNVFRNIFDQPSSPNINYHGDYNSSTYSTLLVGRLYTPMNCSIVSCGGTDPTSEEAKALTIGRVTPDNIKTLLKSALPGDVLQGHRGNGVHTMILLEVLYENGEPSGIQVYHGNWGGIVTITNFTVDQLVDIYKHAFSVYRAKNYTLVDFYTAVYFEPQGGTESFKSSFVNGGSALGELPVITRKGYVFNGWFTEPDGAGIQYTESSVPSTSELTLYADWSAGDYTVTFDACGGVCEQTEMGVRFDDSYGSLPMPEERVGYTFNGWFLNKECTVNVTENTKITTDGDHTLYAGWTPNTYTVTFDPNGGVITEGETSKTVAFGMPYETLAQPTREGYLFAGWQTAEETDDDGNVIVPSATIHSDTALSIASDHTLTAKWVLQFASVPGDVSAMHSSTNGNLITWSTVSAATGYEVYRTTVSNGASKRIALITDPTLYSCTDEECEEGVAYDYKVRAVQTIADLTQYSEFSADSRVTTLVAPAAIPSGLRVVTAESTYVTLSWDAVEGATGYEISRCTTPDGVYSRLYVTSSTTSVNTGCEPNTTYYYKISSIRTVADGSGRSEASEYVTAQTLG